MQLQNNTPAISELIEIETKLTQDILTHRILICKVYQEELWRLRQVDSFKQWVNEFTPHNYTTVHDWVISDNLRASISNWGINASKWSDRAVLALRSAPDDLLEEIVRGLPTNPTEAQVKDAADYVKPSNLVTFPSGNNSTPDPKIRHAGFKNKEAAETDEIIQGNREKMIDLEQKANNWEQKAIALEQKNLELSQSPKPSSDLNSDATADLQGFSQLQDQLKDAGIERAELHTLLNNQAEEINRLTKAIASKEISSESIDDFGTSKDKTIAKQAKRIEQLEEIVRKSQEKKNVRPSSDLERELALAKNQVRFFENIVSENMGSPDLLEKVLACVPKDESGVLQVELNQAIALIDKQGTIVLNLEKSQKELKAEKSKLGMDNLQLAQKVQSLEELLRVPTPKAITAPAQITRPLPLPEVIVEAIAECEKRNYSAMVNRASGGFVVVVDSGSTTFVDAEDVADYLCTNLDQFVLATA